MIHAESKLQQACVKWFDLQYPQMKQALFAIPNGGHRNVITAKILKSEGVRAGVCDMFLTVPRNEFHGLYIEMKAGKGKPSDYQRAFIELVRGFGYKAEIINSFDKFKEQIEDYLNNKN